MVKFERGQRVAAPSSSLGIMRFFDQETAGPKISPQIVLGISLFFIAVILVLKALFPL